MTPGRVVTWSLLLSAAFFGGRCFAQTVAIAQISGFVRDPSGGAVAGAQVRATQTATQLVRQTVTDPNGAYVLPALPVGPYSLEVRVSGFKTYIHSGIVLEVGNNIQINVGMQLGTVSESVKVSAQADMVQTSDNTISQVIDQRRIVDLPLNGRQPTQLILLAGAALTAPGGDTVSSKNFFSSTSISVAGGQANTLNYMLDGADNNDSFSNVNLPIPFPDALQEFSVDTGTLPGQYGLHPGGTVNAVTKSGTNSLHGDLFEFLRNGDVNARNFFGTTHDSLKRNQFGGTVGGPIVKDKLFFFGGFQGMFNRQEPPQTISYVPTPAVMNGDFSTIDGPGCVSGGKNISVLDPLGGTPFPNDQIPVNRFNPASVKLLKYLPQSQNGCGKVTYGIPQTGDEDQFVGRVDWNQSAKNFLFGRYFLDDYRNPALFDGSNILMTTRYGNLERAQSVALGDTYTFTPTLLNSFHATFTRRRDDRGAPPNDINPSALGINVPTPVANFFQTSVSGYFSTGCGICANAFFNTNTYQVADDVNLTRGRHQLAFGVDYLRNEFNSVNTWISNGSFGFNGQYASGKSMGDSLAAFMMGVMNDYTQSANLVNGTRGTSMSLYAQDSFRLRPNLTINLGLRWEPWFVPYDKYDHGNTFSAAAFNAGQRSSVFTNAPAGLLFYGDQGVPRGYEHSALGNFSPRIGIAWDPTGSGKQSIRVSGGILRDTEEMFYNERLTTNAPYGTQVDVPFPFLSGGTFSNPWAAYPGAVPFPLPSPLPSTYNFPNQGVYVSLPPNMKPTYTVQWSVSYQRQIAKDWMATATYIGNKTSHIWVGEDINPGLYIPGSTANTNLRRPLYLQNPVLGAAYSSITSSDQGLNSNYNGLVISLQHRFNQSFTLLTNYTWSHCLSYSDFSGELAGSAYSDPYNRGLDYGNCGFDLRHNWNTSLVAITPARGNGLAARLLGNWQFSPILTVHSGLPMNVTTGKDIAQTGLNNDRPNQVNAQAYAATGNPVDYLDRAAFANQLPGTYGSLGRNVLIAPGLVNFDLALSRLFHYRERWQLEARAEAFNAINHTNFNGPTTNLSNSKFGVITSAQDPRILQFALKLYF
ncbi:MAG: TonB-dependent receptor [Acidobacteria bacterium]|nr:TonB-dependent receptor [Acidobacteriota bacterium]